MNTFAIDEEALKKAWGAEGQYWFDLSDYSIIEDFNIIQYEVPDDASEDDILKFEGVIPYFNVKRYVLAKAYILTIDNDKIKSKFETLEDEHVVEYFWKYFHVYPKLFENFEKFQNDYILCRLEKWCEENSINYTVKL
jgi:hypothetical protein